MIDYSKLKYFKRSEFVCSCGCDRADMDEDFVMTLERIREKLGQPMTISSAFRCENHSISKAKIAKGAKHGGAHSLGLACDVESAGVLMINLLALAMDEITINGFGINARGPWNGRYVHIDAVPKDNSDGINRPALWSY